MPTIPISREYSNDPSDEFGQQSARGRVRPSDGGPGEDVRFGEPPSSTGDAAAAEHQARYNEAAVTAAHSQFLDATNSVMHGGSGAFMALSGADAVHGAASAQKALADAHQQLADDLQNDTQRAMFGRVTAPTVASALALVRQHASKQLDQYEADASRARASASGDAAVNAYNPAPGADNSYYRQCLLTQKLELEKQADRHGMIEPDAAHPDYEAARARREQYIQLGGDGRSGVASTYSNVITRLLNADQVQPAQDYFGQVRDALPEGMRDKLDGYIAAGREKHEGLGAALRVKSQTADFARQQELLDGMLNDGAISPGAHDLAHQNLRADDARIKSEQAANDSHIIGRIRDLKNANPNAAITDLSAGDYAYAKSRGLLPKVAAIVDGHPASDDPALFNQLHRQSVEDPVGFGKLNLATVSGQVSQAHFDALSRAQNAINQQNPKDIEANRLVNRTVGGVLADMQAAGFNTNPDPGMEAVPAHAHLESGLRDAIIVAQQAKNGAPLTSDEARNIANGYVRDQALSGSGYFARSGSDETQSSKDQGGDSAEEDRTREDDAPCESDKPEQEQTDQPAQEEEQEGDSGTEDDSDAGQDDTESADQPEGSEPDHSAQDANDAEMKEIISKEIAREDQRIADEAELKEINDKEMALEDQRIKERAAGKQVDAQTETRKEQPAGKQHAGVIAKAKKSAGGAGKTQVQQKPHEAPSFFGEVENKLSEAFHSLFGQKPKEKDAGANTPPPPFDKDAAVKNIDANAKPTYTGNCGASVFDAIEAGLPGSADDKKKMFKRTNYAKDAGPSLRQIGFKPILTSADQLAGYTPQKGDVVVLQDYPGQHDRNGKPCPAGHIAMFNGKYWVSDKVQDGASGIWAGPSYKNANVGMTIYRR